jgi:predicted ArsR family transcriptional regulator
MVSEAVAAPAADDAGTRERVMALIMERGATTAADVASALAITPAAVRRHLSALARKGLVATRERRAYGARERGRPAKVYVPTDAGRNDFVHTYDALAIDLLDYLRQQAGPDAVGGVRPRSLRRGRAALSRASRRSRGDAVGGAHGPAVRRRLHGVVLHPVRAGHQLCQRPLPGRPRRRALPELCVAEAEAFGRLLGSHVQRLATIAHGDGVCTLHVPHPVASPPQRPEYPEHHQEKESA